MRLRDSAFRKQPLGAWPLHRVPARVHLVQASSGLLSAAVDFIGMLLDVSNLNPQTVRWMADSHPRRGYGPHLDISQKRLRRPIYSRSGMLSNRATQFRVHAHPVAAMVAWIPAELSAALA